MLIPGNAVFNPTDCDDRSGFYYVSIVDGQQFGLLAGPYTTHREAIDMVSKAQNVARRANPVQTAFASFGTCRLDLDSGPGILNKHGMI